MVQLQNIRDKEKNILKATGRLKTTSANDRVATDVFTVAINVKRK